MTLPHHHVLHPILLNTCTCGCYEAPPAVAVALTQGEAVRQKRLWRDKRRQWKPSKDAMFVLSQVVAAGVDRLASVVSARAANTLVKRGLAKPFGFGLYVATQAGVDYYNERSKR